MTYEEIISEHEMTYSALQKKYEVLTELVAEVRVRQKRLQFSASLESKLDDLIADILFMKANEEAMNIHERSRIIEHEIGCALAEGRPYATFIAAKQELAERIKAFNSTAV